MAKDRALLLKEAEAKWEKDQLIAAAEAKWAQEQALQEAPEAIEAGARSALSSATLGLSEPVVAGLSSAVGAGIDTAFDEERGLLEQLKRLPGRLADNYEESIKRMSKLQEQHPVASTVGEIAGFLAPVGPAAALAKGVGKAGKALGAGTEALLKKVPVAGRAIPSGVLGAAGEAAAIGGGTAGAMQAVQNVTGSAQEGAQGAAGAAASGTLTGAALGGGLSLVGKIPGAAVSLGKGAIKTFLGVAPEVQAEYLARRPELANAKSFEEVASTVHATVSDIIDGVSKSKVNASGADAILKDLELTLRSRQKAATEMVAGEKKDLEKEIRYAKDIVRRALHTKDLELRRIAEISREAPEEFVSATELLKNKVLEGKRNALSLLDQSKEMVDLSPIRKAISDAQESFKIKGQAIGSAKQIISDLQDLQKDIAPLGKEVSALEARKLVELFDQQITHVEYAAGFSDPLSQRLSQIRRSLNEKIGEKVPEFAASMKPVAEDTKLLGEAMSLFGTEKKAFSTLKRLDQDQVAKDIVQKIQDRTGMQVAESAEAMLQARALLKDRQGLLESLPESSELKQLQSKLMQYSDPALEAQLRLQRDPEVAALYQKIERAKMEQLISSEKLALAEKKAFAVKNLTKENVENSIKAYMKGSSIENKLLFKRLSEATDGNFEAMVHDMSVMEKFNAGYQHGSRNVNIWGILMTGLATSVGLGPIIGGPVGVTIGATIDRYGPAMAKQILNQIADIAEMPTVQKIANLRLPEPIKEELKRDFIKVFAGAPNTKTFISEDRRPAVSQTIQDSSLGSIKKAKMLDELKSGYLSNPKSLMMGEEPPSPKPLKERKPEEKPSFDLDSFLRSKRKEEY